MYANSYGFFHMKGFCQIVLVERLCVGKERRVVLTSSRSTVIGETKGVLADSHLEALESLGDTLLASDSTLTDLPH
jgi:hypothetical protein